MSRSSLAHVLADTLADGGWRAKARASQLPPPGDWNGDTKINAADYVTWRKDPPSFGNDPNGYVAWRENFSQTAAAGSGLDGPSAVPEPASLVLVLLSMVGLGATHRRRSA